MSSSCKDQTIHELLNDPITQAVMRADRVDPLALRRMLGTVSLAVQERQQDYEPAWRSFPPAQINAAQRMRAEFCGAC